MSAALKNKITFRCPEPVTNRQQLKQSEHGQAEEGDHSSRSQFVREIMFEEIKSVVQNCSGVLFLHRAYAHALFAVILL